MSLHTHTGSAYARIFCVLATMISPAETVARCLGLLASERPYSTRMPPKSYLVVPLARVRCARAFIDSHISTLRCPLCPSGFLFGRQTPALAPLSSPPHCVPRTSNGFISGKSNTVSRAREIKSQLTQSECGTRVRTRSINGCSIGCKRNICNKN